MLPIPTLEQGDRLIPPRELAEIYGIKPQTTAVWRLRGYGPPFIKTGRKVQYRLSAALEWLAKHEVHNTAEGQRLG